MDTELSGVVPEHVLCCVGKMNFTLLSLNCITEARCILSRIDFSSLRSLHLVNCSDNDLISLWPSFPENGGSSQIDTLVQTPRKDPPLAIDQLSRVVLRHLWINSKIISKEWLQSLFQRLAATLKARYSGIFKDGQRTFHFSSRSIFLAPLWSENLLAAEKALLVQHQEWDWVVRDNLCGI